MWRRLTYANVMATLALFFSLTGAATAVTKYLLADDPITAGDLAGSTYRTPVIAAGAVTSGKIADGAIISSKFASSATAPNAAKLAGVDMVDATGPTFRNVTPGENITGFYGPCPPNRIPVTLVPSDPDVHVISSMISNTGNGLLATVQNDGGLIESLTVNVRCLGS